MQLETIPDYVNYIIVSYEPAWVIGHMDAEIDYDHINNVMIMKFINYINNNIILDNNNNQDLNNFYICNDNEKNPLNYKISEKSVIKNNNENDRLNTNNNKN